MNFFKKILSNILLGMSIISFICSYWLPIRYFMNMVNNDSLSILGLGYCLLLYAVFNLLVLVVFIFGIKLADNNSQTE